MLRSLDVGFAIRAMQTGIGQIQLGELATEKGSDEIQAFGRQLIEDQTRTNERLVALAREQTITLPATMTAKDRRLYEQLKKLSGPEFDRTYVKNLVKDYQVTRKDFRKEAKKGSDSKFQQFASNTEPSIEAHLAKIKEIEATLPSGKK